ncbi:MAG: J domain-containing protein [Chloroflexi bacterium]|nr:J domain-containing protein [Chloroflexota bacterium]
MTRRDPFAELGLPADAPPAAVKAAWRRLARTHHPDLASDRAEERVATRRMARINAAYEAALRIAEERSRGRPGRAGGGPRGPAGRGGGRDGTADGAGRAAGPEPGSDAGSRGSGGSRGARPVTRHVDTSAVYRPHGATASGAGSGLSGQPPPPADRPGAEAPRGAPSGPLERHLPRRAPRLRLPDLASAREHVLVFGKFHDRTLGEVETLEPTYIDWIVRTIRRDPDLVASARVIQRALDDAGVPRTVRPAARTERTSVDDVE